MRRLALFALLPLLLAVGCADDPADPMAPTATTAPVMDGSAAVAPQGHHDELPKMASVFTAMLSGDQQVPAAVETRARGQAVFRLMDGGETLHFRVLLAGIEDFLGAHVHMAPAGANGPIALFLRGEPFLAQPIPTVNGVLVEGSATAADLVGPLAGNLEGLLGAMRAGNTYVNVHTSAHPGGEIRGQIR